MNPFIIIVAMILWLVQCGLLAMMIFAFPLLRTEPKLNVAPIVIIAFTLCTGLVLFRQFDAAMIVGVAATPLEMFVLFLSFSQEYNR